MADISVYPVDVMKEAWWSFDENHASWRHRSHHYYFSDKFDPFPAYPHEIEVVRATAARVQDLCPPAWPIEIYVADRESIGRTNGWSSIRYRDNDDEEESLGVIMLSGKRVPPHPAMARYLVGHEYGHHVSYMLAMAFGGKNPHEQEWLRDYAKLRGIAPETYHHGNGGTWHDSVHEIFACDFRILICGLEEEFWPHRTVAHPRRVEKVLASWWSGALSDLEKYRGK